MRLGFEAAGQGSLAPEPRKIKLSGGSSGKLCLREPVASLWLLAPACVCPGDRQCGWSWNRLAIHGMQKVRGSNPRSSTRSCAYFEHLSKVGVCH
jgi:hypothetical protein